MSVNEGLYEDFYVRLGLDLSSLETGLANAGMTIEQNIRRLNHESNLIRLRTEVEIAGLDEAADAERILEIRQNSLNRQMEIQRDRVRLLDAQLQHLTQTYGAESSEAQRTAIRLERARLSLVNLERESRNLTETQNDTSASFGGLSGILEKMSPQLKAVAAGMTAIGTGATAAGKSVEALLEDFRELQNQSYELNMPVLDTRNFLRQLRLGGGDIGDFEGYIRGMTDAYVKGEYDDPEFIALRKYGAVITDATGKLKDFKDITEEVYQAWKKADEAGEGIEFLQLTGGESGIRDAIQLFKRYEEAKEDAAKIFKAEIDDSQLHELDRTLNLAEEQSKELKNALGDIFVPAAQTAAESFFEAVHKGTKVLVENKEEIQRFGFIAAETFSTISEKISELTSYQMPNTGDKKVDKMLDGLQWQQSMFNEQALWGDNSPWSKIFSKLPSDIATNSLGILERATEKQKAFNGTLEEATTVTGKIAQGLSTLSEAQKKYGNVLSQYGAQRVQQFKDELEDLRIELDFDDELEKAKAKLDLWFDREHNRKNFLSDEEKKVITELYSAKLDQINRQGKAALEEINARIQEHIKNAADMEYEMTHTAFEKQIRDIEQWEEAQRQKADTAEEVQSIISESAMKEAQAFEREMERIKGTLQSLEDKVFEQEHSQYENDLRRAQQERIKLYEDFQSKGILDTRTQALIERYYNNSIGKINQRAKESKGGEYTEAPKGFNGGGVGTGIMMINGDQIIGGRLINAQQEQIGLLTDENRLRAQLSQKLDADAQAALARIQATKDMTALTMEQFQAARQTFQGIPIGRATMIQGDQITQISEADARAELELLKQSQQALSQGLDQSSQEVQQFGEAVQQSATEIEQVDPSQVLTEPMRAAAEAFAESQKAFAESVQSFPPEYFKNLADSAQSVSEMQTNLAESTKSLIEAQSKLEQSWEKLSSAEKTGNRTSDEKRTEVAQKARETAQHLKANLPESRPVYETAGIDLSVLSTPLSSIDTNIQSIAQEAVQVPMTFETVVTPLNNISTVVENILSALNNRQPPQVTISPNNSINLGGAYVFDNAMKQELVNDITSQIVDNITSAVQAATSSSNYGYGA